MILSPLLSNVEIPHWLPDSSTPSLLHHGLQNNVDQPCERRSHYHQVQMHINILCDEQTDAERQCVVSWKASAGLSLLFHPPSLLILTDARQALLVCSEMYSFLTIIQDCVWSWGSPCDGSSSMHLRCSAMNLEVKSLLKTQKNRWLTSSWMTSSRVHHCWSSAWGRYFKMIKLYPLGSEPLKLFTVVFCNLCFQSLATCCPLPSLPLQFPPLSFCQWRKYLSVLSHYKRSWLYNTVIPTGQSEVETPQKSHLCIIA